MSHTTPTASSSLLHLVARSFSPLSTLSSSSSPRFTIRVSFQSLSLWSFPPLYLSVSRLLLRPRIVHPALTESHGRRKPSLTSNSKELQLLSSSPLSSLLSQLAPQIAILFALILALFISLSSLYPSWTVSLPPPPVLRHDPLLLLATTRRRRDSTFVSLSVSVSLWFFLNSSRVLRAPKSCISCPLLLAHRLTRPSWDSISDQLRGFSR